MLEQWTHIPKADWEIVALLAGWLGWAADRIQLTINERRVSFSLESDDSQLYIINNGKQGLELLRASVCISDVAQPKDLAKKKWVHRQMAEVIAPGEKKLLLTLDGIVVEAVEEIFAPTLAAMRAKYPQADTGRFAKFDMTVEYKRLNARVTRTQSFNRWIGGHPNAGWGIQYDPYHHDNIAPIHLEAWKRLQRWGEAMRHPIASFKNAQKWKPIRLEMRVKSVLFAMHQETITEEEGKKRLKKIIKQHGGKDWEDLYLELWSSYRQGKAGDSDFDELESQEETAAPRELNPG